MAIHLRYMESLVGEYKAKRLGENKADGVLSLTNQRIDFATKYIMGNIDIEYTNLEGYRINKCFLGLKNGITLIYRDGRVESFKVYKFKNIISLLNNYIKELN